jgi:hypothetical protein
MPDAQRPAATAHSRDRALRLLSRLTWWVGGIATVAVAVFATVAASTIPGRSAASASTAGSQVSAGSSSAASSSQDDTQTTGNWQQPASPPASAPATHAHAVSGGS